MAPGEQPGEPETVRSWDDLVSPWVLMRWTRATNGNLVPMFTGWNAHDGTCETQLP